MITKAIFGDFLRRTKYLVCVAEQYLVCVAENFLKLRDAV